MRKYYLARNIAITICMVCCICACDSTRVVTSYVAVHEGMQLANSENPSGTLLADNFVEAESTYTNDTVTLRPNMGDYSLVVHFDSRPSTGHDAQYHELDQNGTENSFLVIKGPPPITVVDSTNRYATVALTDLTPEAQSKLIENIPTNDKTEEILSVRYEINWDTYTLTGIAHIARSTHEETDYLLD